MRKRDVVTQKPQAERKPRWTPYKNLGYQDVSCANGQAWCFYATEEDYNSHTVTVRDREGNTLVCDDAFFVEEFGGKLQ